MKDYLQYWLPGAIAAIANIIFYLIIKKSVDNSIERQKIAYSGVFKEKIEIYKSLLLQVHDLKLLLNQYQYSEDQEAKAAIRERFNQLIRHYLINRPFLSENLLELFKVNTQELQSIFENLTLANVSLYRHMTPGEVERRENAYWSAVNRLRDDNTLASIEHRIIEEMRKDLKAA